MECLASRQTHELARAARAGCLLSFEELARRFQVPLLHFLASKTGNVHDAEDLLQETFLRAFKALARYDLESRFETWIFTIAYRLAISQLRMRAVRKGVAFDPLQHDRMGNEGAADTVAGEKLWPVARRILSGEQFTALWLRYVEDLPIAEVATVLSRTHVGTKVLLFRARRALAKELAKETTGSHVPDAGGSAR